jgi:hypothetical protein
MMVPPEGFLIKECNVFGLAISATTERGIGQVPEIEPLKFIHA